MEFFLNPDIWLSLLILTWLEIVLGIDNIVFIVLITSRLPLHKQRLARRLGLSLAMLMRLLMLSAIVWLTKLSQPIAYIGAWSISIRDIVLLIGGSLLLIKSIAELYSHHQEHQRKIPVFKAISFIAAIVQIILLDIVFSLDSILTAIAITNEYWIMATAIIIAVCTMMVASELLSRIINRYPRVKLLALYAIFIISIILLLEAIHIKIPHYYLYLVLAVIAFLLFITKPKHGKSR